MSNQLSEPGTEAGIVFRLLGPTEVIGADGRPRAVVGRQQSVLAALLLAANHVVSVDQLVDAVWEDDPPLTARAQVQFCISALRRMFLRLRLQARIDTQASGYKIRLEPGQLDSQVFETEAAAAHRLRAQGHLPEAADLLRVALGLWSGDPLDGASASLQSKTLRLVELRRTVLRECIEVELELQRHGELVGELQTLVAAHGLDEGFRAQLMTALVRSGRASEALEVYREGRAKAMAELGLEPGAQLRRLEAAILEIDAEPTAAAGPAEVGHRPINIRPTLPTREPTPRQLPADIADFSGRARLVSRVQELLDPKPAAGDRQALTVVSLFGMPGIGKSTLAVHVAHRISPHAFPDGQLHASLGGSTGAREDATAVLARFLRALGVPEEAVPPDPIERADLYRTLLADRQVLVVLDDACDEGQLAPLLPGSPNCAVLITTRRPLVGLAGAHPVGVDLLPDEDIVAVLGGMIGDDRSRAEPGQLKELAHVARGLPLAARILGARLAAHPHWSLASMVHRLQQASNLLDQLRYGDWSIRDCLLSAYRTLNPNEAKVLQTLATADGPSVSGETLDPSSDSAVIDLLDGLVHAQLLHPPGPELTDISGYRLHPLVRAVAEEQAVTAAA